MLFLPETESAAYFPGRSLSVFCMSMLKTAVRQTVRRICERTGTDHSILLDFKNIFST